MRLPGPAVTSVLGPAGVEPIRARVAERAVDGDARAAEQIRCRKPDRQLVAGLPHEPERVVAAGPRQLVGEYTRKRLPDPVGESLFRFDADRSVFELLLEVVELGPRRVCEASIAAPASRRAAEHGKYGREPLHDEPHIRASSGIRSAPACRAQAASPRRSVRRWRCPSARCRSERLRIRPPARC